VLSVLPKPTSDQSDPCIVVPSTLITFLGRIYKFIFCLDVSQSLASVVRSYCINMYSTVITVN
jgi:hypothetical protein